MRGFGRLSVAVPVCAIANPMENAQRTLALWKQAHDEGAHVVIFPELGLSGYTARDLFLDRHLLDSCEQALTWLRDAGKDLSPLALVGAPLRDQSTLYNTAFALHRGQILGAVPKAFLPNYREFEERRWFRPGTDAAAKGRTLNRFNEAVPFGTDLLFEAAGVDDFILGVEICEDYWVQLPPSTHQVNAGATVIANLSASNFTIGKADLRRLLARSQSDRGKCAYAYVAAGPGESSTDLAFDADAFVCENGSVLVESERFARKGQLVTCDVDLESLVRERMVTTTFGDCAADDPRGQPQAFRRVPFVASENNDLRRAVSRHPFLPRDETQLATRCWEMFEIQTHALLTRMQAIGSPKLVLGVSGGLDSTQAALVAAAALDLDGRPRSDLICITMPGLGTTPATKSNAEQLAKALGATFETTSVSDLSHAVLVATGHPAAEGASDVEAVVEALRNDPSLGDRTLENVQARLRTLVLMTRANAANGIVIGTGDLSEKALGWSTYNGDHIAMYDVNAGIPKTLIQFVIKWVARDVADKWSDHGAAKLSETLAAIVDTPISPELLPPDAAGKIAQLTEDTIGPYELHDFFLFHFVRHGCTPERVLHLAEHAFEDAYAFDDVKKWFRVFIRRFFSNQFKRSCTADGPKVGMVALSPRGDWRMPSDAQVQSWTTAIDSVQSRRVPSPAAGL